MSNDNEKETAGQADPEKASLYQIWREPTEVFFQRIDACGGWPALANQVVMRHTLQSKRLCYFSEAKHEIRDEWNTTIARADDYYLWKLSSAARQKILESAREIIHAEIGRFVRAANIEAAAKPSSALEVPHV
jgi:hypothetical protein